MQYTQQQKRLFEALYGWVYNVMIQKQQEYPLPYDLQRDKMGTQPNEYGTVITYNGEPFGIISTAFGGFKPITNELHGTKWHPDTKPEPLIDARELGRKLFSLHTHAELCKPEEIVYREADVINLLTSLGLPAPQFGE